MGIGGSPRGAITCTGRAAARQLLRSLRSRTFPAGSAQAIRRYVPTASVAGTVTVREPFAALPRDRGFSLRRPLSARSLLLRLASFESR